MPGIDRRQTDSDSGITTFGKQGGNVKKQISKVGKGSGILDENGVSSLNFKFICGQSRVRETF